MASNEPDGIQSSWLTIVNNLDNLPYNNNLQQRESFNRFFDGYWSFSVLDGSDNYIIPVGYIADWLVKMIPWDRHPLFTLYQGGKLIFLDAKHDTAQPQGADSEASRALRALTMELLEQRRCPQSHIEVDRNAAQLFGILTTGAHMTCHTWEIPEEGRQMKLWVACRALNKKRDAGKLDNTVSGGITTGDTPLQTILAEAEEEASLSRDFVAENFKETGTLSYFNHCSAEEEGHLRPRALHTFELELPQDMLPRPHDGEVSEFLRMDAQDMKNAIMAGEMTDDAAVVWLGFLVRHGIVDEQNEPDLRQITGRMHRHIPFPLMGA